MSAPPFHIEPVAHLDRLADDVLSGFDDHSSNQINLTTYLRDKQHAQQLALQAGRRKRVKQSPAEQQIDLQLQVRVVQSLSAQRDPIFRQIMVEVTQKTAVLSGGVATEEQLQTAVELARRVSGVKQVQSQLTIDPELLQAKYERRRNARRKVLRAAFNISAVVLLIAGGVHALPAGEDPNAGRVPLIAVQGGQITIDAQVPVGAMLIFHRADSAAEPHPTPTGIVRPDGTYQLTTYESGDGAPAGNYRITVYWKAAVSADGTLKTRSLLPDRYSAPRTSPLKAMIDQTTLRVAALQVNTNL